MSYSKVKRINDYHKTSINHSAVYLQTVVLDEDEYYLAVVNDLLATTTTTDTY